MIGSGQHVWVQMWGPDGEIIADGVLEPGSNICLVFSDGPQPVAKWALTRITHEEAEAIASEKGVQQAFGDPEYVAGRGAVT